MINRVITKKEIEIDRYDFTLDGIVSSKKIFKIVEFAMPICLEIPRSKKHVSIIIRKGKILSIGTNIFKGHPIAKRIGYRFEEQHSELSALLKCDKKDKLTLVNVRFNKNSELRMARPCDLCIPWCLGVFDEIYYTASDGTIRLLDKERYHSKKEKNER